MKKIMVPDGATVGVEGPRRHEGSPAPQAHHGYESKGATGSASEKQRKLIYARCKQAGVSLEDALAQVGISDVDALDRQHVNPILKWLEDGAPPAPSDSGTSEATDDLPF